MIMRYDIFDFTTEGMTLAQRAWRVAFLLALVAVLVLDLFVWRP
jgi:hypothetical protein